MKRGAPLRRGKGLRRVSAKRAAQAEAYRDTRMAVNARDRGVCQAAALVPAVRCSGPNDPHHLDGRRGDKLTDVDNVKTICAAHHAWVHANTRAARRLGLLR